LDASPGKPNGETVKHFNNCINVLSQFRTAYGQGRSQDFSKGGAEVMEAKAL